MKKWMALLIIGISFGAGYAAAPHGGPYSVGTGKPSKHVLAASSTSSGTLTVDWTQFCVNRDASGYWQINFASSTGQNVNRILKVDAACTQVTDGFGGIVYTTTGGSDPVCTTLSGAVTRSNSLLSSCASGGKCNL